MHLNQKPPTNNMLSQLINMEYIGDINPEDSPSQVSKTSTLLSSILKDFEENMQIQRQSLRKT